MARATKPRFVDTGNPAMAIDCPKCGLVTSRFLQFCRNCGFSLWPSSTIASAAFEAWRDADPARRYARRYDLELPVPRRPQVVDYEARAHQLGIHISPNSPNPFVICVGVFLIFLALPRFPLVARIVLFVLGLLVLLWGVIGWVIREDVKIYDEIAEAQH